jgi:type II secretory pathway pseudopilin PulG
MAISPIDLQTLFTQVDKIGKQEAAQREGAAIQQAIQQARSQQVTEAKINAVNEAPDQGEGAEGVRDGGGGRPESGARKKAEEEADGDEKKEDVIRDPDLGRNIDVSL